MSDEAEHETPQMSPERTAWEVRKAIDDLVRNYGYAPPEGFVPIVRDENGEIIASERPHDE